MIGEYVIETNDLSKVYNNRVVVDRVNMHIERGDIYGFVGENGAGKTTIIRLLSNLTVPTAGTYKIFGFDNNDKKNIVEARKKMGAIVEVVALDPSMNALNNLRTQCILTNTQKTNEELIKCIESVGLNYVQIMNVPAKNFSLGMRQRLGIAMCMVSDPEVVLLDEPMNGLDPQGIIDIRQTILDLNSKGVTFLISSHILAELDKVCNKVGIISHGRLIEEISMDDLHKKARKKLCINTKEPDILANALITELNIKDIEKGKNEVVIFDTFDTQKLMEMLVNKGISFSGITETEDTIEDYYLSAIKGENR